MFNWGSEDGVGEYAKRKAVDMRDFVSRIDEYWCGLNRKSSVLFRNFFKSDSYIRLCPCIQVEGRGALISACRCPSLQQSAVLESSVTTVQMYFFSVPKNGLMQRKPCKLKIL